MNTRILTLLALTLTMFLAVNVMAVQPFGANYTGATTQTAQPDSPQDDDALAGNVTELQIIGFSTTQSWQGYFGNVTGTIQLADNLDKVMYNWSLASPEGEVYATINNSVNWTGTACAVNATDTPILEANYGINATDVDGVDETFFASNDHDEFYVNNIQIAAGTCELSARIFDNTGVGVDQHFEEVILKAGSGEYVFASILDEEDVLGFDDKLHDFEMLVLENGHGIDVAITTYYFYVELE